MPAAGKLIISIIACFCGSYVYFGLFGIGFVLHILLKLIDGQVGGQDWVRIGFVFSACKGEFIFHKPLLQQHLDLFRCFENWVRFAYFSFVG